jgi:hypothetical protein
MAEIGDKEPIETWERVQVIFDNMQQATANYLQKQYFQTINNKLLSGGSKNGRALLMLADHNQEMPKRMEQTLLR